MTRRITLFLAAFFALLFGVASPAMAAPVVSQSVAASTYTVRYGDTLSGIASRYGLTWQQLWTANRWIVDPNRIYAGWVLTIPTGTAAPVGWTHPAGWTCITSGYGARSDGFHNGTDFALGWGNWVTAIGAGRVQSAFWDNAAGNIVVLDHGNGITSHYMHLSRFNVSPGQWVGVGAVIAWSGNTGWWTSGPHLHLSVRQWGSGLDPVAFLRDRGVATRWC